MAKVFLHAPQDFRNLCVLARTLEVLGYRECYVFDPRRLVREHYGKSRSREMRVVSAGAFGNIQWNRVEEPEPFLANYHGRVIATVADAQAITLTRFHFSREDLILFGSESHGLPTAVVDRAQESVTIPSRGKTQSLNLAVALAIVLFEVQRQLGCAQADGLPNKPFEPTGLSWPALREHTAPAAQRPRSALVHTIHR